MYSRNLLIFLLATVFCLMVPAQQTKKPSPAPERTPPAGGIKANQPPEVKDGGPPALKAPDPITELKARVDDLSGRLLTATWVAGVLALSLVLLLIFLVRKMSLLGTLARTNDLADRPTRQELRTDLQTALADRPTRQDLIAQLQTALADRPTRQELQQDLGALQQAIEAHSAGR